MQRSGVATLLLSALLLPYTVRGGADIAPRLAASLRGAAPGERIAVWIYFAEKGGVQKGMLHEGLVTPRAIERRARVLPYNRLVDASDLPVNPGFLRAVERAGAVIRQTSKWLNAASAWVTVEQLSAIASLPGVRSIDLMGRFPRDPVRSEPSADLAADTSPGSILIRGSVADRAGVTSPLALDYGPSLSQVTLLNIPAVHDLGNAAQGVIVGVFDNGFRLLTHTAFDSLRIIGQRDFVDHKESVIPNNPASNFGSHGVNTLSTIAGYKPGQLIGPAFRASYILGRTENDSSETPIEEDNWVAAIEWAESLGVQVTSTSLGYLNYDGPYTSWTWEQMDGKTTAITRAAAMAVRKGIVVVNSAGNNGSFADTSINTLNAPADGDSVLAVGAVTPSGVRASFSSVGPSRSVPPRIKPEVMATGTSIYVASSTNVVGYGSSQGTSFACPLAAGVAALVLAAHPAATPMEIVGALKATASRASAPNNQYGWGIVNALAAINYLGGAPPPEDLPFQLLLSQNYPNPFNPRTDIGFGVSEPAEVSIVVYDLLGRRVATVMDGSVVSGYYRVEWDGTDAQGSTCASGLYIYRFMARTGGGATGSIAKKMMLIR